MSTSPAPDPDPPPAGRNVDPADRPPGIPPTLVVFRGLPGTGKTHLARLLVAAKPGLLILSRDVLRASIVPQPTYDEAEKALIDDLVVEMARRLLAARRSAVIDGMALSSAARLGQFVSVADSLGARWRIIECTCSERTALSRIAADAGMHPAGDRGEVLYYQVKERFASSPYPVLRIDTDQNAEAILREIVRYLENR